MTNSKRNRNQGNSQVTLVTDWQYTEEVPPAFKRLMMLLLQIRNNQPVEISRVYEEHQNEQ